MYEIYNIDEMKTGDVLNIHRYAWDRFIINHHYRTIEWREYETKYCNAIRRYRAPYVADRRRPIGSPILVDPVSLSLAIASNGDRFVPAISRNRRRLTPAVVIARRSIAIYRLRNLANVLFFFFPFYSGNYFANNRSRDSILDQRGKIDRFLIPRFRSRLANNVNVE